MDAETFTKVNCHASPTLARYFERDNEILYHTSPTIAAKSARFRECLATRIDRKLIDVLSDLLILRDIPDRPTTDVSLSPRRSSHRGRRQSC